MCGRFTLRTTPTKILNEIGVQMTLPLEPRYNIAPTQTVSAIRQLEGKAEPEYVGLRWGLVPFWADDLKIGSRMINARSETVADKPAFRAAFKKRRCLIPADGFFEWKTIPGEKTKQPYMIRLKSGEPFVFAGLWERWDKSGPAVETCTILTTSANTVVQPLHDRMPVILPQDAWHTWLETKGSDADTLEELLVPFNASLMETYPVSKAVNNPKHDDEDCVEPVE